MWFFDMLQPSYWFWKEVYKICDRLNITTSENYIFEEKDIAKIFYYLWDKLVKNQFEKSILRETNTMLLNWSYYKNNNYNAKRYSISMFESSLSSWWLNRWDRDWQKDQRIFAEIFWY